MNKSTTKIERPQTAGVVRSPAATSTPQSPRPSSHRAHRYLKTKRSAPVERPPVPAWMLDTPLYSKVPMVAAPAGKIMLYTTGLCEKLHTTPRGFDFDSSPQGLSMTYSSLHDPNLKGYYTTPRMYSHLTRSGFLTPCGMVKCGLKEFNEYHQYVKQVQLEQLTQQRKHMIKKQFDRIMHTHHHKPTHKKRAAPPHVGATSSKHHRRSSTKSLSRSSVQVKSGGGSKIASKKGSTAKTKKPVGSVTQAHHEKKQHAHKRTRRSREMKAYERQSLLLSKRFDEEMRREQELERRKLVKMAERELNLQEQWDRREANREVRLVLEASQREKEVAKASKVKVMRSKMVEAHQARQKAIFESIRDARAQLVAQREALIARRLEKRLGKIRRKYHQRYRRQWAALKHLIVSKEGDEFVDAEQDLHREDEMYSSDDITAAIERTAKHLSSRSHREKLSSPNVSSSSSEDATVTPLKKEQPELTITDKVLSVTSLDYRRSPNPEHLSKEEPGGTSMMRDVYLADDSGKEDGNLKGAGAVSPGIPAISSGMGLADEMREGPEAGPSAVSEDKEYSSSSSASMKSTSRSSSDTTVGDKSPEDEVSANRKELEVGEKKGQDSEDETSEEESSLEKSGDASSEESDFWKSESVESLQEVSLSSFSEEEKVESPKDEVGREEDLVEETLEAGETKVKDESKKVTEVKMEATVEIDDGDVEKQEMESKKSTIKQEAREEKPGTEQEVDTEEVLEGTEDKLEPAKKEREEKLKKARGDEDDIEVLEVLEENLGVEKKKDQEILEEQDELQKVSGKDNGIGMKTEEKLEADQVMSEEIEEQILKEERETEGNTDKEILATETSMTTQTSSEKQEIQRKDPELEQKIEIRERLQDESVEEPAIEDEHEKDNLEIQQEVREKDTHTKETTEIGEEIQDGAARDEEKEKEEQVQIEKQEVSQKKESTTKIEETETIEDELKQVDVGEGKVEENQIVRQASDVVASVMKRSICQLSTACTTGHEGRTEDGQWEVSQEARGQSEMQGDSKEKEKTAELASDSILLANVMNILEEVEHDIHHHHHHHHDGHHHEHHTHPPQDEKHLKDEQQDNENGEILSDSGSECDSSSSSDSDEEEGEIIGVVENEIIADEGSVTSLKGCLSGEAVPGLTEVVKETDDHRIIFEGALMPLKHHSSTSTTSSKVSINVTAAVLSAGSLKMDSSGRLKHDMASHSHTKPELKVSTTDIPVDTAHPPEPEEDALTESSHHHYSNIVPVYHDNLVNVGEELIDANLSAISMKPDRHHKVPSSYSTASRNSFRNIFRPDMTYCQGSAKCLKDTLVRELSHSGYSKHSKHSSSDEMEKYYDILEEEQEDVTAHHSEEELVTADDTAGVCYLPKRRTYKVRHTTEATVHEQDEIQPSEVPVTTEEDKMPVIKDSSEEMRPPPTQVDVQGDTTLPEAETEPRKSDAGEEQTPCTESLNQVVESTTKHGDEQTSCDDLTLDRSCDDSWVVVESIQPQQTGSEVHADLDQTGSDLTRVDGCEEGGRCVEEKPGLCEENTSDRDLHKAPTEGHTEIRPGEAVGTVDKRSSNTQTPEIEMRDHGVINEVVNGQASAECSEETGNLGNAETVDRPSSNMPTPEIETQDHGVDVIINGPCEVNTVQEVNEMAGGESSERQEDGNEDEKQVCEPNPDDTFLSETRQIDTSKNGDCAEDNHQMRNRERSGNGEHETCPSENPPDTQDIQADVMHPDDNCQDVSCLNENIQSYTSAASLSSSMTLPISCGETPESASSDMFSDFASVSPCPGPLPNTVLDPMDSSYTPALRSPKDASNTDPEASHEMSNNRGSMQYHADGNKSDPSTPHGSASDIPTVSSHPAVSESKSSSSRKSGSRMSAVMKKISSVFSLGRKHSSRVHPGDEVEDEAQRKAKDEDAKENH
ncbi:uncharacterized protein LOC119730979 [Patiria miniata]|uniref:Uncharacterized protein n=1 Tax=Patiria miniata TaxID=46514 RepID=A0A914A7Z6_PATMI|nr:uncharacterized protein LOC119730979 [Patiria miniata]